MRALTSHKRVPGSIPGPGLICGLSLLLALFSDPRGFSPGTPFPSPRKLTLSIPIRSWKAPFSERVLVKSLVLRG